MKSLSQLLQFERSSESKMQSKSHLTLAVDHLLLLIPQFRLSPLVDLALLLRYFAALHYDHLLDPVGPTLVHVQVHAPALVHGLIHVPDRAARDLQHHPLAQVSTESMAEDHRLQGRPYRLSLHL